MYIIKKLSGFDEWLNGLKDRPTKIRLIRRLDKAKHGLLGDVKPVGDGIFEMRKFFGPGWRMYYLYQGNAIILMLGGGNKATQAKDIEKAIHLANAIRTSDDDR